MKDNDQNHYFIRMNKLKQQKKEKKEAKQAETFAEKNFDSPVDMSTDHQQNDCESQSSGKENKWDKK